VMAVNERQVRQICTIQRTFIGARLDAAAQEQQNTQLASPPFIPR
jgi:hypothetical protein